MNLGLRIGVPMTRAGGGSIWTPALLPNLAFRSVVNNGVYSDLAGTTPQTTNNGVVKYLPDPVGGYHLTTPAGNTDPHLKLNTRYKGKSSLAFDGVSNRLSNTSFALLTGASQWTWVVLFKALVSGSYGVVCCGGGAMFIDVEGSATYAHQQFGGGAGNYPQKVLTGRHVIMRYNGTLTGNANRLKVRENKIDRTLTFTGSPAAAFGAVPAGLFLGSGSGAAFLSGEIFECLGVARALSDAECDLVDAYAGAAYFGEGLGNVHCLGDSLTSGYPDHTGDGLDWPTKLAALLGTGWATVNNGQATLQIPAIDNNGLSAVDPDRDVWRDKVNSGKGDIVITEGGTNDISPLVGDQDGATVITRLTTMNTNRKTPGFRVLTCTIPHSNTDSGLTAPQVVTFNSRADTVNAAVRAGTVGADAYFDPAADPLLGDPANKTYRNADGVHYTAAGNDLWAGLAYAAIVALP